MANYQQSEVQGSTWKRAFQILIRNPTRGTASIEFSEELVVQAGSELLSRPTSTLSEPLTPEKLQSNIELIHPETGKVLGNLPYQTMYIAIYSLYMRLAKERDIAEEEALRLKALQAEEEAASSAAAQNAMRLVEERIASEVDVISEILSKSST